jgi:hypothetical protein
MWTASLSEIFSTLRFAGAVVTLPKYGSLKSAWAKSEPDPIASSMTATKALRKISPANRLGIEHLSTEMEVDRAFSLMVERD